MYSLTEHKVALFLNGTPPSITGKNWSEYKMKIAVDGAYLYMKKQGIRVDYIIGDLDSLSPKNIKNIHVLHISEQNSTDMEKALNFIYSQGYTTVDVYGASGLEQDHFLGNLHVAYKFFTKIKITFFDEFHSYFFLPKRAKISTHKGQLISLMPFPKADGIYTSGLLYALNMEELNFGSRIGIRNRAIEDEIEISFKNGSMLIFIGRTA